MFTTLILHLKRMKFVGFFILYTDPCYTDFWFLYCSLITVLVENWREYEKECERPTKQRRTKYVSDGDNGQFRAAATLSPVFCWPQIDFLCLR